MCPCTTSEALPLRRLKLCDADSRCRVGFLLSKGVTLEEAHHAMCAVGVPPEVAAAAAAAAAAAVAAPACSSAASVVPAKASSASFWRRLLVAGTAAVGAWSAWNLYGEAVVKWGSGMIQWLEGGGEAAADASHVQQLLQQHRDDLDELDSSFISPSALNAPPLPSSSRITLQGNAWVDEGAELQQLPTHVASPLERNERALQAEALKVRCRGAGRCCALLICYILTPSLAVPR